MSLPFCSSFILACHICHRERAAAQRSVFFERPLWSLRVETLSALQKGSGDVTVLTSWCHHPHHPPPLKSRCQIENKEKVNLRGSEWITQQQLSRYCCHRDERYGQRFFSPCKDASSDVLSTWPDDHTAASESTEEKGECQAACVRLTSNRPMEAVVWLVCITSVRAHICWILEDTVWGSGRPWRQTGGRMSSRGGAEVSLINTLLQSVTQICLHFDDNYFYDKSRGFTSNWIHGFHWRDITQYQVNISVFNLL